MSLCSNMCAQAARTARTAPLSLLPLHSNMSEDEESSEEEVEIEDRLDALERALKTVNGNLAALQRTAAAPLLRTFVSLVCDRVAGRTCPGSEPAAALAAAAAEQLSGMHLSGHGTSSAFTPHMQMQSAVGAPGSVLAAVDRFLAKSQIGLTAPAFAAAMDANYWLVNGKMCGKLQLAENRGGTRASQPGAPFWGDGPLLCKPAELNLPAAACKLLLSGEWPGVKQLS